MTNKTNPETKRIGKKAYSKASLHHTKKKANLAAKQERKRNRNARIVPSIDKRFKHVVYVRTKKPKRKK